MTEKQEVLGFIAEWYDPQPQLARKYLLKYFVQTHEVEMVDCRTKRLFLKRTACPESIDKKEFYVGSKLTLFARAMTIIDFADPYTKRKLQQKAQKATLLISGPAAAGKFGKIVSALEKSFEIYISNLRMYKLSTIQSDEIVTKILGIPVESNSRSISEGLSSSNVIVLTILGEDSISKATEISKKFVTGHALPENSIIVGASDRETNEIDNYFGITNNGKFKTTATFDNCTCCIVKPHAIKEGLSGGIISMIEDQGYEISAMQLFNLDVTSAKEFLEVYQGVVPEYIDMVDQLCEGPCIAMEVRAQNAVETFRQTAGPWDVEMAKELRPNTIRAVYGTDRIKNAIHCTDLAEDGTTECQYFFDLLQSS